MKKNSIKVIILITILLCIVSNNFVYGAHGHEREEKLNQELSNKVQEEKHQQGLKDPTENPGSWEPTIYDDSDLSNKAGTILGIINAFGIISSVIVLVMLGIKYMFASVQEKADYKKALLPYCIGIFLLVASTTIPNIIYKIVTSPGFFG